MFPAPGPAAGSHDRRQTFQAMDVNPDLVALERALWEVSGGTMSARVADVVRFAREKWGYPGSVRQAVLVLRTRGYWFSESNIEETATVFPAPN
jgi:hypothetical protein